MKDRLVSRLMLDERDEISFLLGPWGAVARDKAIEQIESGARNYFVLLGDGFLVEFEVIGAATGKRLYADCGETTASGLDETRTFRTG